MAEALGFGVNVAKIPLVVLFYCGIRVTLFPNIWLAMKDWLRRWKQAPTGVTISVKN